MSKRDASSKMMITGPLNTKQIGAGWNELKLLLIAADSSRDLRRSGDHFEFDFRKSEAGSSLSRRRKTFGIALQNSNWRRYQPE